MITFILLGFFCLLAIGFALIAYSSNNRKRAGMKGTPSTSATTSNGGTANRVS